MKLLTTALLTLLALQVCAQDKLDTHYFDENDQPTDSAKSYYYSFFDLKTKTHNVIYTGTNQRRYVDSENIIDTSVRTYYYRSGEVITTGKFVFSEPVGRFVFMTVHGKEIAELEFPQGHSGYGQDRDPVKILQYWDASGNKVVDNGNGELKLDLPIFRNGIGGGDEGKVVDGLKEGIWKGSTPNSEYEEKYSKGKLTQGKLKKDGKEYWYAKIEESAMPKGGLIAFYKFIGRQMRYPASARRARVDGKVFVEFVVDKDGSITDVSVVKGFHPDCDAEAVKAVKMSPAWLPGYQRGIPVKQRMVLPITFRL